ncbi:citrate transporter [Sphingomonas suaedae]|uniref:Citrate transporter n=1 Tax=Sphingomonas suaedae TaxID=2599297 RepID=A0A518RIT1_9SPHN|nr:citrate:proton symporter [Sphingomonas suaedae]QDX27355.1 citrate transporter [Sphingomonas suaedae]
MTLALLGFATVATFILLIMTRRLSAAVALIAVPILFGLLAGAGDELGAMVVKGIVDVAPIALLLSFAILYFGIMMDAGLFDPLVRRILDFVGNDPMRIAVGTAALSSLVSIDGDGTTTALIVISALLPVYRTVGMNPLILATLLGLTNSVMNYVPWGGPSARAATALKIDLVHDLFIPMVPTMLVGLGFAFLLAWRFGRSERQRLGWAPEAMRLGAAVEIASPPERRPHLFWVNLLLTLGLMGGMFAGLAPLPVLMMGAFALAATINYPRLKEQRERIDAHATNVVTLVALIFAAGSFTGILEGTGMLDAMARAILAGVPPSMGPYLAPITAMLSMPLTFLMSNDAYYFGIVPVVAQAASSFGVPAEAIARASLIGQPVHSLSPLLAPIYLACALLGVEVGDVQRFALKYAILMSLILLAAMLLTGIVPLSV